ncbi:MAG: 2-hydroxyacyl-CoA dehydratase [Candidatus Omnitrophica bacterium]|nr:2-hydroxyacyl-CoA dehydratase [Candidatus Omnitrophota bacterium]
MSLCLAERALGPVAVPRQITLEEWDEAYERAGSLEPRDAGYGGLLGRHVRSGNTRLARLQFDNSFAALKLWNFLLTEEDRLRQARLAGKTLIGAMKDLGTVPVIACAYPDLVAFYPDGAWWLPCLLEDNAGLLAIADRLGVDESFCPVRAMLGAFVSGEHFPRPDLLVCSVGATCDDFSAIAQRVEGLGHPVLWWELPQRREPEPGEKAALLPGGARAGAGQVAFVQAELARVITGFTMQCNVKLTDRMLAASIHQANKVRSCLAELRRAVFTAGLAPLPALELLVAEMLALHYCSDRAETLVVLEELLATVRERTGRGVGFHGRDAVRVFWVNPVADLKAMNLLEECGGRICGTDYLFTHALDQIPDDIPPLEALARVALADPMAGTAQERAQRIQRDMRAFGSEALIISRIPGASHCALEGEVIREIVTAAGNCPVLEIEVPSVCDPLQGTLRTRLEALVETVRNQRKER